MGEGDSIMTIKKLFAEVFPIEITYFIGDFLAAICVFTQEVPYFEAHSV